MKPVLLVDLSSIFWPAWHAAAGKPVDTAYIFALDKVHTIAADYEYVAICCDGGGKNWRHDLSPAYKAHRQDRDITADATRDQAMIEQHERLQEQLVKEGFVVWKLRGEEADDLLASAATALPDTPTVIASSDKDLLQLVMTDGPAEHWCQVLSPMSGKLMTDAAVKEKFGVMPDQIGDYLAMVGDSSDNIKGVPGIGPKRAAPLLREFTDISGIIAACGDVTTKISPSIRTAIMDNLDVLALARKLVDLRTDIELPIADIFKKRERTISVSESILLDPEEETPKPFIDFTKPAPTESYQPSTKLAKSDAAWSSQLEPSTGKEAMVMAEKLFASRLLQGYGNPEAVWAVIIRGREMGLGAMTALGGMHFIKGKVTMSAQLMIGLILNSGKCDYFQCTETTAEKATYATHRKGDPQPTALTFTLEDARLAKLLDNGADSNWAKYPRDMLRARASAALARMVYPDILANVYDPEELGA